MDYQIKSTPFIRRMVSTSKQNGQLQKLKDEYERIKEFNDHALEMRMKQVRLKRLFQEIEEIKENEIRKRRMIQERAREKAALIQSNKNNIHEQRIQDFMRTQTLSSKFSGLSLNRPTQRREQKSTRSKAGANKGTSINHANGTGFMRDQKKLDTDDESKARMIRRLNYGNQISSWNMQKMLTTNLNREVTDSFYKKRSKKRNNLKTSQYAAPNKGQNDIEKYIYQKELMNYENNQKSSYSKESKTQKMKNGRATTTAKLSAQPKTAKTTRKRSNQKRKTTKVKITQPIEVSSSEQLIRVENSGSYSTDECETSKEEKVMSDNETTEGSVNAKRLWRKLALMLQKRQDNESFYKALETLQKCSSDLEYQLRSISNVTNLPESIIPSRAETVRDADNEDTGSDVSIDDTLINSQVYVHNYLTPNVTTLKATESVQLDDVASTSSAASAIVLPKQSLTKIPAKAVENDFYNKTTFVLNSFTAEALNEQVQSMINKYLPFSMDVVKAEIADYSSKRLRQVFEEQSKPN